MRGDVEPRRKPLSDLQNTGFTRDEWEEYVRTNGSGVNDETRRQIDAYLRDREAAHRLRRDYAFWRTIEILGILGLGFSLGLLGYQQFWVNAQTTAAIAVFAFFAAVWAATQAGDLRGKAEDLRTRARIREYRDKLEAASQHQPEWSSGPPPLERRTDLDDVI